MTPLIYIEGILQGIGLVAIAALAFERVLRGTNSPTRRTVAAGVVFGFGTIATMSLPIEIAPGLQFDLRYVLVVLSAPLGGPVAALIVMATSGLYRIGLGGIGAVPGGMGIVIAGLTSLYLARILRLRLTSPSALLAYGLGASLSLAGIFILPWTMAISLLMTIGPTLVVGNLIGVFLAAYLMEKPRNVISRERSLRAQALTDPLTGLSNRRHFDESAADFIKRTVMAGRQCAMILVDIDHFKSINDTFGHESGDVILKAVAQVLSHTARNGDLVCRYGGEEFALLIQIPDRSGAEAAAERLRNAVESMTHRMRGLPIRVTVSIGFRLITRPSADLGLAIAACDAALYRAKAAGRNRVEVADAA